MGEEANDPSPSECCERDLTSRATGPPPSLKVRKTDLGTHVPFARKLTEGKHALREAPKGNKGQKIERILTSCSSIMSVGRFNKAELLILKDVFEKERLKITFACAVFCDRL